MTARLDHPAKFPDAVLEVARDHTRDGGRLLDPFAGTGRVHLLADRPSLRGPQVSTVGVELEPEWAELHPRTIVGNALALPFPPASFDAVVTSPTFGNRMADHHEAGDDSRRITYRHVLGRPLSRDNAGGLQWGPAYRAFHQKAWGEVARVLRPDGTMVLDIKDHHRAGVLQPVTDWHLATLVGVGFDLVKRVEIATPSMRFGANADQRADFETVAVLRRAS